MSRRATGHVIVPRDGRNWAIRFRAYGKRRYVPAQAPPAAEAPTFYEFASEWLESREPELRPKTLGIYRWLLSGHLLPHLGRMHIDRIGPRDVDRYKAAKLREGTLGPNQINKSLGLLAAILDAAGDYGYISSGDNPARGRRRRVKGTVPRRPTVEPEQLPSLLKAARGLRPILATMAGAGLRNGEACGLDWSDFDPAGGTLTVGTSKTAAGVRRVDLPDALRRELAAHGFHPVGGAERPMFCNREGRRQTVCNVERRLKTAIRRANTRLAELGLRPIDEAVTPHSLRRLYASLRFALGDDPVYVANQLGHTEPGFSIRVYASAVRRRQRLIGVALREFDAALNWAAMGDGEKDAGRL